MYVKIESDRPDGYYKEMDEFSAKELKEFLNCKRERNHPEYISLKNALLKKRAEFNKLKSRGKL